VRVVNRNYHNFKVTSRSDIVEDLALSVRVAGDYLMKTILLRSLRRGIGSDLEASLARLAIGNCFVIFSSVT